jgi:hypothetical protein
MCIPLVLSVKLSRVETKYKSEAKPYVHASIKPPSKRIKHEDDSDSNGPGIPPLPAKASQSSTPEYVPPSKSMLNVGQTRKPVKKYLGSGSRTKLGSTPKLAQTSTAPPVASDSRTNSVSTYINSSPCADTSAIGTSSRTTSTTRSGELLPLPRTNQSPSSEFHQPPPQMQVHSGLSRASASAEGTSDDLKQHLISRNIPLDAFIRFAALLRSSGSKGFDQRLEGELLEMAMEAFEEARGLGMV